MEAPLCAMTDHDLPSDTPTCALINTFAYCDQTPMRTEDRALFQLDTFICAISCPLWAPVQARLCSRGRAT